MYRGGVGSLTRGANPRRAERRLPLFGALRLEPPDAPLPKRRRLVNLGAARTYPDASKLCLGLLVLRNSNFPVFFAAGASRTSFTTQKDEKKRLCNGA